MYILILTIRLHHQCRRINQRIKFESASRPVPLEKSYRLLNHGPTVLVSAQDQQTTGVMTAAWACALEFSPAKVTVVLNKATKRVKLSNIQVISPYKFRR